MLPHRLIWFLSSLTITATSLSAAPQTVVDFDTDVIAAITRLGCNAGACHGSAKGQGGFKLSLWGGNATADYDAIVRQMQGRRINLHNPQHSLLLLKPSGQIEHEGGYRLRRGSQAETLLTDWIKQGAQRRRLRTLATLTVRTVAVAKGAPADVETVKRGDVASRKPNYTGMVVLDEPGDRVQLKATATFSDGTTRDVTAWTTFVADDTAAVSIDKHANATAKRRGQHVVTARYLNRVIAVQLVIPLGPQAIDLSSEKRQNFIDDKILATLATLRLPVSPIASDSAFIRRVSIDLTGKLPTPDRIRTFLEDQRANKRSLLIDELLQSDAFADYWAYQYAKLFRINSKALQSQGAKAFHQWLREQIKDNAGFDVIARHLLTAEGDSYNHGPANFARIAGDPLLQAEFVSETLMGVRLRCANCHDHPLDRWTQDDYHGLAAIFARIQRGRNVGLTDRGEVTHPRTGQPAIARLPGTRMLTTKDGDARQSLSHWLTQQDNAYFARSTVNRLWGHMMGRGLVEPVNDLRATNPPTHPALLRKLTDHFTAHKHDLRATLRVIANSATYQRSHHAVPANKLDDRFYSHAQVRSLEPEVLADAIADATGSPMTFVGFAKGTRAVQLFDSLVPSTTLDILGRCDRSLSCESETTSNVGLDRQLHLINGPLINSRVRATSPQLRQWLAAAKSDQQLVEQFYLATLSRLPTAKESAHWVKQLATDDAKAKQATAEDIFWALLSCQEFVTNH